MRLGGGGRVPHAGRAHTGGAQPHTTFALKLHLPPGEPTFSVTVAEPTMVPAGAPHLSLHMEREGAAERRASTYDSSVPIHDGDCAGGFPSAT